MLENINIGQKFNSSKFLFESKKILKNDKIYNRINGKSYKKNNNISLKDLIYIKMLHYNYNNEIVVGEMIVNKVILEEIKQIFKELFNIKYQINSMKLIDDFWIENDAIKTDRNSIINNNSSCFCYRKISKTEKLSNHAFGIAIDINPLDNPYTPIKKDGSFDESNLTHYEKSILINREEKAKKNPHIITLNDNICKIFKKYGFECGGIWPLKYKNKARDWQHFEPTNEKMLIIAERIKEEKNKD